VSGNDNDRLVLISAEGHAGPVYGFALGRLAPMAARVGPTFAELSVPNAGIPEGNRSPAFTRD
jgi:hypothetical protein